MTFQEFRQAVAEIAGDRYHSVTVESNTSSRFYSPSRLSLMKCTAYIGTSNGGSGDCGSWEGPTPEAVLAQMRGATDADVEQMGEVA